MHRTGGGSLGSCAASRAALPRESRDTGTAATAADQRQRLFHNQHQILEECREYADLGGRSPIHYSITLTGAVATAAVRRSFFSSQQAPAFWMSLLNSISRYLLLCFPRSTNLKELRRPFHHHPRHCQRLYGPRRYLLRLIQ